MDFDYYEDYLTSISNKYIRNTFMAVSGKAERKTDTNFNFFQAAKLLIRF